MVCPVLGYLLHLTTFLNTSVAVQILLYTLTNPWGRCDLLAKINQSVNPLSGKDLRAPAVTSHCKTSAQHLHLSRI